MFWARCGVLRRATFFWAKLAAFAAIGLISILPTRTFISWVKRHGRDAAFAVTDADAKRVPLGDDRTHLLVLVPLFAALMARGIGARRPLSLGALRSINISGRTKMAAHWSPKSSTRCSRWRHSAPPCLRVRPACRARFEGRETTFEALEQSNRRGANRGWRPRRAIASPISAKNSDHYLSCCPRRQDWRGDHGIGWRLSAGVKQPIIDDAQAHFISLGLSASPRRKRRWAATGARPAIVGDGSRAHAHPVYQAWRDEHPKEDRRLPVRPEDNGAIVYRRAMTGVRWA